MHSVGNDPNDHQPEAGRELVAPAWTPPPPRSIPQMRRKLVSWLDQHAADWYFIMIRAGHQPQRPPGDPLTSARALAAAERARVAHGDLYWVSPPMVQLARAAGQQLSGTELHRHDLPAPSGLMVWAEPMATYTNVEGRPVEIVAASWGPWRGPQERWDQGGIWITFYSHPAPMFPPNPSRDDPVLRNMASRFAPIMPDNESGCSFGAIPDDQPFRGTAQWALTLFAAWLLMRQPLTSITRERTGKPRRTGRGKGERIPSTVQLVHVRRRTRQAPTRSESTADAATEHDHQWWVTGHWRRYHCGPGGARIERRYISPYLAGPEDKPIRGNERVNVWDR